ncbi:hypothetical protein XAP412_790038 [Xanthomonas phaseoli pv. phaseoli]|uniref:Uncharacterized protein n=1 Tax=Xanthomonas campestris pv. phaseoli TaxID=317013 RepID=A0AB38E6S3_XANCH|nr:hypothetical protein XAP6984_830038 [Xanthomonas phaseoli pv. phaseoli]SON90608.1 hypothetical protein XAP412_790038 [Xanthomonas phaseoli pv. phaseoli]SON92555.1 hypothetical protein XAP7430_790038 [Xanthomonas phaseoli pv. phaseoli]SOO29462.1 hypothetical protein XAP6164_3330020 [Xanthomonas phaseoli pv. phaseoli]
MRADMRSTVTASSPVLIDRADILMALARHPCRAGSAPVGGHAAVALASVRGLQRAASDLSGAATSPVAWPLTGRMLRHRFHGTG